MLPELLKIYNESRINPGEPKCLFAETLIFNEGWMLRAVLKEWLSASQRSRFGFLPFPPGAKVYSEAQLYTPFKARYRGDQQAESHTHVDGIVGDFELSDSKSGIRLSPDFRYLAVFEAKIYSPLSKGTKNAPHFDQVSRTAACMSHAILEAGPKGDYAVHLVVLYAAGNKKVHPGQYTSAYVEEQIAERIQGYLPSDERSEPSARFFGEWKSVLSRIQIQFLTWEDVLAEITNDELNQFYRLCKKFN